MASHLNRSRLNNGIGSDMLSDSTYDMMSDSIIPSDEEDEASVASFDDHETADITSIGDTDSLREDFQEDQSDSGGIPTYEGLDDVSNLQHSARTVPLVEEDEPVPPLEIQFDEQADYSDNQISVVRILGELSDDETARISQYLQSETPPSKLVVNVCQTMSKELLALGDDTFRILYIGEESAKETIIAKIGAALVVSSGPDLCSKEASPSRYNIVPVSSFGNTDSSPDVELVESFGVGMEVHTCSHAGSAKSEEGGDTISLVLHPRAIVRSSWTHSGGGILEAGNWKLPHLVVYYCTEHDDSETRQTRDYAKAFMARHSVPGIVISDNRFFYEKTHYVHGTKSVHMSLESPSSEESEGIVYKRIPVTLQTFLSLDNRQMNRNIACITGLCKQRGSTAEEASSVSSMASTKSSVQPRRNYDGSIFGSYVNFDELVPKEMWTLVLIGWFLFCGIMTGCLLKMKLSAQAISLISPVPSGSTGNVQVATPLPQVVSKISSIISASASSASAASSSSSLSTSAYSQVTASTSAKQISAAAAAEKTKALGKVYELANSALSLSDAPAKTPQKKEEEPEKFTLHSIGDGHIVIRPPSSFLRQQKQPRLHVSVTKDDKVLDVHLSEIFQGVYDLAIHGDDAWGLIKIDIHTKSKPLIKEAFTLDLGSQWLKVNSWKKVAWRASSRVQKHLDTASDEALRRAKQLEVPKVVGGVNKVLTQKAEVVRNKIAKAGGKVAGVGDSLYKDHLSKPLSGLLNNIKQGSLQSSVGEKVTRAQKRATRLWKKGPIKDEPQAPKSRKRGSNNKGGSKKARKLKGVR